MFAGRGAGRTRSLMKPLPGASAETGGFECGAKKALCEAGAEIKRWDAAPETDGHEILQKRG